jgi:hypothetical protein
MPSYKARVIARRPEPSDALPWAAPQPHRLLFLSSMPPFSAEVWLRENIITHKMRKAHQVEALVGTEVY